MACEILVLQPEVRTEPSAVEAQSSNILELPGSPQAVQYCCKIGCALDEILLNFHLI